MVGEIDSYIDANYVKEHRESLRVFEDEFKSRRSRCAREEENRRCFESRILAQEEIFCDAAPLLPEPERMPSNALWKKNWISLGRHFMSDYLN